MTFGVGWFGIVSAVWLGVCGGVLRTNYSSHIAGPNSQMKMQTLIRRHSHRSRIDLKLELNRPVWRFVLEVCPEQD